MAAINWGTTGTAPQSLNAYLVSIGVSGATGITTLVDRLTTIYPNVGLTFSLVEMMNGVIPFIMDVAKNTWSLTSGAMTSAGTMATWLAANRPDCPSVLAGILDNIIATDINTTLMPSDITAPSTITIDSCNIYITGVATLLINITKYLRHFCGATNENWTTSSTSSTYGTYVAALPEVRF
jgi:hypothetical protein